MAIDLDFRPSNYFWPHSLATHLLARVKGAERQRYIRMLIGQGRLSELDDWLAGQSLTDGQRETLGRIHPSLMGGEYLPDLRSNEVEIARISLRSVTGDVYSVRARRGKHRIYYRLADEYGGSSFDPDRKRHSSIRPLTLARLVDLIEEAGAGLGVIRYNWEGGCGFQELRQFLTATSPFYPDLELLYQTRIDDWIAGILAERDEDYEDDEDDVEANKVQP
jgi:hypothetical protein